MVWAVIKGKIRYMMLMKEAMPVPDINVVPTEFSPFFWDVHMNELDSIYRQKQHDTGSIISI